MVGINDAMYNYAKTNNNDNARGQAGTVNVADPSTQPNLAVVSPQTSAEREEISLAANEFSRYCSGIIEKFQTGQLSLLESMVQIALELSRAPVSDQEAQRIVQHSYSSLERI